MSRGWIMPIFLLSIVGCSSNKADNAVSDLQAATMGANESAGGAVTMEAPTETKVASITMKDLAESSGLAIYPGAEKAAGDRLKRNDGGLKDQISFSTGDSLATVGEFFKTQGLDVKVGQTEGSAMGMTKKDAQVIVGFTMAGNKQTSVLIKSLIYAKKSP